jgi:hypothetical protein
MTSSHAEQAFSLAFCLRKSRLKHAFSLLPQAEPGPSGVERPQFLI